LSSGPHQILQQLKLVTQSIKIGSESIKNKIIDNKSGITATGAKFLSLPPDALPCEPRANKTWDFNYGFPLAWHRAEGVDSFIRGLNTFA
jgi:hypothetical protein